VLYSFRTIEKQVGIIIAGIKGPEFHM